MPLSPIIHIIGDKGILLGDLLTSRDNRQQHRRRMLHIVIHPLLSYHKLARYPKSRSGVQVAIIFGEGARRDLHANPMSCLKHLRRVPTINTEMINLARLDQRWMLHAFAEAGADHAITQALAEAVG